MNGFSFDSDRQHDPNMLNRTFVDASSVNQNNDIRACQTQNPGNVNEEQFRRSSITYFADEAQAKADLCFDTNEIFRPENVVGLNNSQNSRSFLNQETSNSAPVDLSPITVEYPNEKEKSNRIRAAMNQCVNESKPAGMAMSSQTFFNNFAPPLTSSSSIGQQQQQHQHQHQHQHQQQQQQRQSYDQYQTQSTPTENDNRKRKDSPVPNPPSKVRFRSHQAESWMEKYEELLDFRLSNGHCLVPNQFPQNPPLAEWVKRQRYQYKLKGLGKHSSMTEDRVLALAKLGFVWNSHDAVWEERLKELKQYKNVYGNTNVPSKYEDNPQLAIWVKRQRRQYKFLTEGKQSTMTPQRMQKLNEINFSWSGRKPKASDLTALHGEGQH
eukprot:CAMPEP_0172355922 /NCGR_PEP_ID=MMETSP1060-20121228/294_1 /TAXON_ID=37318 /ORGANISM="Pseudo-nitzschia pungens, Strain cf. cingulata" /LENGTH=381 /DNA_ID=CAMNT_0013075787 /DNA_START=118 /DNA_END=1263 /DNA_ORIENTATION=+